jgi:two-component sensor histidine kinase
MAAWMSRASPTDYPRWWQSMESLLAGRIANCDVELWDEQPDPTVARCGLRISAAVTAGESTIVGLVQPLSAPAPAEARIAAVPAPAAAVPVINREELVREIHHRIKNHLQGMTGLVERYRNDYPALGPALDAIGGQLHAIGTVYGLLARSGRGDLALDEIARAVADGLSGLSPCGIQTHFPNGLPEWHIAESFCVSIALLVNELVMNAIKHSTVSADKPGVSVEGESTSGGCVLRISNPGRLPERFDFESGAGAQTGLQLVRAMLPFRGATLAFRMVEGEGRVEVELTLQPPVLVPSVQRGAAPRRGT